MRVCPRAIISDQHTIFAMPFAKVMLKYGVTHRLSTAYHLQTSGQVEVSNRGLKRILERTVGRNGYLKEIGQKSKPNDKRARERNEAKNDPRDNVFGLDTWAIQGNHWGMIAVDPQSRVVDGFKEALDDYLQGQVDATFPFLHTREKPSQGF
ncbi:reverse transcriptase domain-containing protein [Tanacetum coccineum]